MPAAESDNLKRVTSVDDRRIVEVVIGHCHGAAFVVWWGSSCVTENKKALSKKEAGHSR